MLEMIISKEVKSGEYVLFVPIGLPITIQYGENGVIEKVFEGFLLEKHSPSEKLLNVIYENRVTCCSIPLKGGTTWVSGVLYCDKLFKCTGTLPECAFEAILGYFLSNPNEFNFFVGQVESTASVFDSASTLRRWASLAKFHMLPGSVITESNRDWSNHIKNSAFKNPLYTHYIVYGNPKEVRYVKSNITSYVVEDVKTYTDEYGNIKDEIITSDSIHYLNHADVVRTSLTKGSIVISNKFNELLKVYNEKSVKLSDKYQCKWCYRITDIPKSGEFKCADTHCMSRQYPVISHFLHSLDLPEMTYTDYAKKCDAHEITCLSDIFLLPQYKDLRIHTTWGKLLSAIVPSFAVPNSACIESFCSYCKNNSNTIHHYLENPSNIKKDFDIHDRMINNFIEWLSDPYNILQIETIAYSENIILNNTNRVFEGAPIFRSNIFLLTGDFLRGTKEDIESIIRSYSGTVTDSLDDNVSGVIVGSKHENINGMILRAARKRHIPIIEENQFFSQYEIDNDIKSNLL